jgi:hypothetical protein
LWGGGSGLCAVKWIVEKKKKVASTGHGGWAQGVLEEGAPLASGRDVS